MKTLPLVGILCLVPIVGCGSQRRDTPLNTLSTSDPKVQTGEIAFMRECNQCHPSGAGGLGPAINDKPLPQKLIKTQVRAGLGAMPSFSPRQLSDQDVDAIVSYLKALRTLKNT